MDGGDTPVEAVDQPQPLSVAVILAVLAASAGIAGFAISSQSFWIDEALSLVVAMAASPSEAWGYAQAVSGSTLQMPLYQVYLFVWHKLFGGGEWAMRASNLPWIILAQLAFLILLRHRPKLALTTCLLAAVSPLLWAYLDETRPYVMQYAAACWLTAVLLRLTTGDPPQTPVLTWLLAALGAASVVLIGSSLLGVLWAGGFFAAILWIWISAPAGFPRPATSNRWLAVLAILIIVAIAALGAYYLFTWESAGRGYHRVGGQILAAPYIAYEMLGFAGFGPGKLQLRIEPVRSIIRHLPALLPLAVALGLLGVLVLRHARRLTWPRRRWVAWALALVAPAAFIFIALLLSDHRALPRHFIPALPALLLVLAAVLVLAFGQKSLFWRATAALVPLLWLGSALNLRWQPVHAKDDYRTAARIAAAALRQNKEVWWAADAAAAHIYLTPVALEEVPGRAWAMQAPEWDDIRFKFPPRVIVISKPDIYDPRGAITRYAAENQFSPTLKLHAFTIFTRRGEPLPGP